MANILVVYDTKYGQTEKIARFVGDVVRRGEHEANVVHVGAAGARDALASADGVIVLAPVFVGKHLASASAFVRANAEALASRPGAFFSVSASAGSKEPKGRVEAERVARSFAEGTSWRPLMIACFGGAIAYPRYDRFLRFFVKIMTKRAGGPTDTSRIHELTDWTAVERATTDALEAFRSTLRRNSRDQLGIARDTTSLRGAP